MSNILKLQSQLSAPGNTLTRGVHLTVVYHRIDALILDPANPRLHSKKQIRQIANSITAFGFNVPVLVDAELKVIAGHGRILACDRLGITEVPTLRLEHLSPAQARAFMIADNRLAEIAGWDDKLLAQQLKDLSLLGLDFSLELTGFELGEIDLRIASLEAAPHTGDDRADALPEVRARPPLSRIGDVWLLGRHRVLCGNARDRADVATLLGDERAAVIFTAPPHRPPIDGPAAGSGAIHDPPFLAGSTEISRAELIAYLRQAFQNLAAFSADGSIHYLCIDWQHFDELLAAGREVYGEPKDLCIWVKDSGGKDCLYHSQHELVLVFKHGRNGHRDNVKRSRVGRNRSNVWHYRGGNSPGDEGNLPTPNSTLKPVAMVADAILDCSARGNIVLDPFLRNGTTLIAAERTGRRCYGLELDPAAVDLVVRRWQSQTGKSALHAGSGRSFDDLAREAEPGNVE